MLIEVPETSSLVTFLNPLDGFQSKAPYVKTLCLDWALRYQREPDDSYVFDEDLVQASEIAIPAMPALKSIEHSGIIYQESLQQLLKAKVLQFLYLRLGNSLEECATWNDAPGEQVAVAKPSSALKLNLSILGNLAGLRCLTIEKLLPGEGHGLGLALKELHHLENFKVVAARLTHFYYIDNPGERGFSPVDGLLLTVFPDNNSWALSGEPPLPSGFPKTLKNLSIIDRHSTATALTSDFFQFRVKSFMDVEKLRIHMSCIHSATILSMAEVLDAFLSPSVQYVQIPLYENLDAHPEILPRDSTARTRAQEAALLLRVLLPYRDTIIQWVFATWSAHQSFNKHPAELDALWEGLACYRQICLGRLEGADRGPVTSRDLTAHLFDNTISAAIHNSNAGIFQPRHRHRHPSSWGRDVRHMIAPFLDLSTLFVDSDLRPRDTSFDALRVLILNPGPSRTNAEYMRYYTERVLAVDISLARLPSLRVVVVGAYTFWFEMPEDRTARYGWKVWALDDAVADTTQWAIMKRELHAVDWKFFSPVHGSGIYSVACDILVKRVEEDDGWRGVVLKDRLGEGEEEGKRMRLRRVNAYGY